MTKVTLHYDLERPLTDADLDSVADIHSCYGMARVVVAQSLDKLTVDFDASRLTKFEVEATLQRYGLPIRVVEPAF